MTGATLARDGRRILDAVDLTIAAQEIVTLVGPNGAGKSTLVKAILGLEALDGGTIEMETGAHGRLLATDLCAGSRTSAVGAPSLDALTQQRPPADLRHALEQVGVAHLMEASVHVLSGGELQRVMLARAILRKPDLLLLDEPTQNVDMTGAVDIYRIIAALPRELKCSVFVVSHDLNIVMAATDRVYCLNGHVCCSGRPEDVSRHPEFLRLFGPSAGDTLAVYPHAHDHVHGPDGAVVHERLHAHPH